MSDIKDNINDQNNEKNCFSKGHEQIPALYFCPECKIFMCKECENFHSKFFFNHNKFSLDKKDIFTGFCKEENHFQKFEYFCITHNMLCCSSCIVNIEAKGKGQHKNCNICLIEDIKNEKKNLLNGNIQTLDDISANIDNSINEFNIILKKKNNNGKDIKIKLEETFNTVRNKIKEREDELKKEIEQLDKNSIIEEDKLKKINKMPKIIKELLEKGEKELSDKEWKDKNKLSLLINECINIEKNILDIVQTNRNIKKYKKIIKSTVESYEEKEIYINKFFYKIMSLIKEYNDFILTDDSNIDLELKSIKNEIKNGISIELLGFNSDQYIKYYPEQFKYEENENLVLSIYLEGKDLDSVDSMVKILNKYYSDKKDVSIRKEDYTLILDFKKYIQIDSEDIKDIINEFSSISFTFKSLLKLNEILKIDFDELFIYFFSCFISIKGKENIINKLIVYFEKRSKFIEKIINKENEEDEKKKKSLINEKIEGIGKYNSENETILLLCLINIIKSFHLNFSPINFLKLIKKIREEKELNDSFKSIKEDFLKEYCQILNENKIYKDILKYIKSDKFLIKLLFVNYKSGFILNINSDGLENLIHDILSFNNKDIEHIKDDDDDV